VVIDPQHDDEEEVVLNEANETSSASLEYSLSSSLVLAGAGTQVFLGNGVVEALLSRKNALAACMSLASAMVGRSDTYLWRNSSLYDSGQSGVDAINETYLQRAISLFDCLSKMLNTCALRILSCSSTFSRRMDSRNFLF
jgi:hypothetical protein